jgi:NAD(P)-dependent dehydrogenase (short-subunit alcohol dehydrogenase family)
MGYDVSGKRVLVTGGSSGIGAGLAERFAAMGATVGICARRSDELAATLDRCRAHVPESQMWVCDMAIPAEVDALADGVMAAFGGVDVLVNNAGIPRRKHVTQLDYATVETVMRINYLAPVQLTLALLPQMLERGEGRVVNVSSIAAPLSSPGESAYDASKAALSSFSEAMAMDLWFDGVKVMVVYPGVVDTPLFDIPDNDPLPDGMERIPVSEMVEAIVGGLSNDAVEVYAPAWFKDIVVGKAQNLPGFLAGAAQYLRDQKIPKL